MGITWEKELSLSLRTAEDLCRAGLIGSSEIENYRPVIAKYRLLLPRYYASLIDPKDPHCPIRKQAVPSLDELRASGSPDPLEDFGHRPVPNLTHRYHGRVLVHLTPNCSMYCRFCFRKSLLNELRSDFFSGGLQKAVAYISADPSIEEVIFSGGDPLLVGDVVLAGILAKLRRIDHIQRLRIHTRVPVTFPSRISRNLVKAIKSHAGKLVIVTHFNHPREITPSTILGCARLKSAGVCLLNQSVLLEGVNNDATVLADLSRRLFGAGILPYYLHHPDPTQGTAYFNVSLDKGLAVYRNLQAKLSGYLVPRYVVDKVGVPFKMSAEIYRLRFFGATTDSTVSSSFSCGSDTTSGAI